MSRDVDYGHARERCWWFFHLWSSWGAPFVAPELRWPESKTYWQARVCNRCRKTKWRRVR